MKLDSLALPRVKIAAATNGDGQTTAEAPADGKAPATAAASSAEVAIDLDGQPEQPADQVDPVWRAKRKAILDEANRLLDAMQSLRSRPPQAAQTATQPQASAVWFES